LATRFDVTISHQKCWQFASKYVTKFDVKIWQKIDNKIQANVFIQIGTKLAASFA